MARALDHLVMVVDDLEAARTIYEAMGFCTTPRALHPFGTENFLIQLQGNFLETVGIAEPSMIPPHAGDRFSFAAGNAAFLERRQGMSSLVFQSGDARADREDFLANGLKTYAPLDFSRQAGLPDGSEVTVSFSLAFVTDPAMPETTFFVCQQHAPEHFWKPAYQRHANTATVAAEVIMVAEEPGAHRDFFRRLHGSDAVAMDHGGLMVTTPLGGISVLSPSAYAGRFGVPVPQGAPATTYFAGFRIAVADLAACAAVLANSGLDHRRTKDALQIGPAATRGVAVEFTQAQ